MILRSQKKKTRGTFAVLCRHFFIRFFQNDSIAFAEQQTEKIVISVVILSSVAALLSILTIDQQYFFLPDSPASWKDKCYFISIIMLVFAVLSILEWDNLFVDRRDFLNFGHLPISSGRVILAKITAMGLFISLYCFGVAMFSGIIFTFFFTHLQNSILHSARYFIAHFVSLWAACLFVFLSCTFFQSFFMILLPRAWFKKICGYLQFLWVFAVLILFSNVEKSLTVFFDWLNNLDNRVFMFPSLWFTGMYEWLIGRRNVLYPRLALVGIGGLALLLFVYIGMAFIGYRRHFHRDAEQNEAIIPERKFINALKRLFLRHPHERAAYDFTAVTIKRSSQLRLRLGGFLVVGTTLALLFFINSIRPGSGAMVLAFKIAPLHLLFVFSLIGLRAIVEIPVQFDANWIFRSAANERPAVYRSALIKAVVMRVMLPIAIMGGIFHWLTGGAHFAIIHVVFVFTLYLFVAEITFRYFRKIPFTCSYLPGKAKLKIFVGPYLFAFLLYLTLVTLVEQFCLARPVVMIIGIFLLIAIVGILHWAGLQKKDESLRFFEEPDPVMLSLEIDRD